ncbi:hypothetical protein N7522_011916 [Penicillium canescens]|nr:hypothetical protein N7522_011916 [Penicillium canescens]
MATIRIADPTYAGDEPGQPPSCDDGSSMGPAFSKSQSMARSYQEEIHESIYNIRSRSRIPERISSRISAAEQPDDDPGLQNPSDFKQRQMNITHRDPREASLVQMKRYLSGDLESAGQKVRKRLESSRFARGLLKVVGVLAVTMVLADGLLTPAQSVLGAVQGIEVVQPSISKGTVVGVTDAILIVLFFIQPLGITKLSFAFSPIVIIWLGFNAATGIYNLANYDAGVFQAFNPGLAFEFLIRNKTHGWRMLGGTLLAFTVWKPSLQT